MRKRPVAAVKRRRAGPARSTISDPPGTPPAGPMRDGSEGDHIPLAPRSPGKISTELLWNSLRNAAPGLFSPSYVRVDYGELPKEIRVAIGNAVDLL